MSFRDSSTHLRDILEAIHHIELFVSAMTFESYENDLKTKSAVERQLQIMTEAAIRLGKDAETIAPSPDWEGFRRMGNLLRHAYHRIDDQIVWNTVKDELRPCVKSSCRRSNRTIPASDRVQPEGAPVY